MTALGECVFAALVLAIILGRWVLRDGRKQRGESMASLNAMLEDLRDVQPVPALDDSCERQEIRRNQQELLDRSARETRGVGFH